MDENSTTAGDGDLVGRSREILRGNDRGGYTVPSPKLYPFQWNWDSAVVALGWMTFDEPRAWLELDRLLEGQWANGMVPHIVFHRPEETYFPGPAEWGLGHLSPPTSGISQPPLLGSVVRMMRDRAKDKALANRAVARLVPRIFDWHRWWFRDRDPERSGLVASFHPWESGMDNSPAWDAPLASVPPATRAYTRRDTGHVDPAQRPQSADYDRFVRLMDLFRELDYDPKRIHSECPYRVADFGLNAILLRSTVDLAELCEGHSSPEAATELREAAGRMRTAMEGLWSERLGQYVSRDLRAGRLLEARTHATFLAWHAGLSRAVDPPGRGSGGLEAVLEDWLQASRFGLASVHPRSGEFDARRYWRGPIWPHVNWLVARGLEERGRRESSGRLRDCTLGLVRNSGFKEYFDPTTGEGCGGGDFSWTAAVALLWAGP